MGDEKTTGATLAEAEPILIRVFDAPRDLVWKAWTEADAMAQWWGPKGFAMSVTTLDLRSGGVFHYSMRAPNGREIWGKFVYREIAAPERLVFINCFSDAQGGITRNPWMPDWPLEVLNILTLSEHDGKTTLTLRGGPLNATDSERKTFAGARQSMQQGFKGTFDQLDAYLAKG